MPDRIGKYLLTREQPTAGKTKRWTITGNDGGALASVLWYGPWRQYVMEPDFGTVFNSTCLRDIVAFLDRVNAAQRESVRQVPLLTREKL